MKRIHWLVATLSVLLIAACGSARADYVKASRHALVKAKPQVEAETLSTVERDDTLALASLTQKNGYYKVELANGQTGWVYRTFVRRFAGELPGGQPTDDTDLPAPAPEDPAVPAVPTVAAGMSPFAYGCLPVPTDLRISVKVLNKPFFVIGYSDQRHDPLWVCYAIGPRTDPESYKRPHFGTDHDTLSLVKDDDYKNEDYSRGHMAPRFAISSRFGKAGNDSTFIMSNVCPQFQSFNDGHWGNLEEWIAGKKLSSGSFISGWADEYEKVWVTVGPIFDADREPLKCGVEVPNAFFCIVIDEVSGNPRAMAFTMDHEDKREGILKNDLTTIRKIEARTGLNFFSCLPASVQEPLETTKATDLWPLPQNPN